jgi:hypothetical protein
MQRRISLLAGMVMILATFLLGCGGGGSSSGGGTATNSMVGSWDVVSWSGGRGAPPDQMTNNADGTGTFSGTRTGSGTYTWSASGNTMIFTVAGGSGATSATVAWTDNNNVTITTTSGQDIGQIMNLRRR